jgi:hypothetical protein
VALLSAKPQSVDRKLRSDWKAQPQNLLLSEKAFHRMISLERKRSERSQSPFVLLLIDTDQSLPADRRGRTMLNVVSTLQPVTRETDEIGWYELNTSIGVMFREVAPDNDLIVTTILSRILSRINASLRDKLVTDQLRQIRFAYHLFPEKWERHGAASEKEGGLALNYAAEALLQDPVTKLNDDSIEQVRLLQPTPRPSRTSRIQNRPLNVKATSGVSRTKLPAR